MSVCHASNVEDSSTSYSPSTHLDSGPRENLSKERQNNDLDPGAIHLSASRGHDGRRRVVLGYSLNTQTLMKTVE